MYLSTKHRIIQFSIVGASMILAGCAGTGSAAKLSASAAALTDTMIIANKGDVEGLYKSWIVPLTTYKDLYIPHANESQSSSSEVAIRDGFRRFCFVSNGTFTYEKIQYGDKYRCHARNGAFIGEFTTNRIFPYLLRVTLDSPQRVERRAAQLKSYQARISQNGPTGILVTNEGKLKFIRFGKLKERHVLELRQAQSDERIPIEDISKIEFSDKCCDAIFTLRGGRTITTNQSNLVHLTSPTAWETYGGGKWGFPIVVIDPESGEPVTRVFENLTGIKSIVIDDASNWRDKTAGAIATTFDPLSTSQLDRYTQKLRSQAKQLYEAATKNGTILLLPDNKLPPPLLVHLRYKLKELSAARECDENALFGMESAEVLMRCRIAAHEYALIIESGYSLVTDVTPLSSIIVLNEMKKDLIYPKIQGRIR